MAHRRKHKTKPQALPSGALRMQTTFHIWVYLFNGVSYKHIHLCRQCRDMEVDACKALGKHHHTLLRRRFSRTIRRALPLHMILMMTRTQTRTRSSKARAIDSTGTNYVTLVVTITRMLAARLSLRLSLHAPFVELFSFSFCLQFNLYGAFTLSYAPFCAPKSNAALVECNLLPCGITQR